MRFALPLSVLLVAAAASATVAAALPFGGAKVNGTVTC